MSAIAVLGAGASGHAVAGFLGMAGHEVRLWNRADPAEIERWLEPVARSRGIRLRGVVDGVGPVVGVTTSMAEAVVNADAIIVCTTADALGGIAMELAGVMDASQPILLIAPGALGSLEMARSLQVAGLGPAPLIAETSTTIFGSRSPGAGEVTVSGRKAVVEVASLPGEVIAPILRAVPELGLTPVDSILSTGLNNVGPALHVVPMVLNAARIDAGESFRYYIDGVTPAVARAIERFDEERLAIARAHRVEPVPITGYLTESVGATSAFSLYEAVHSTPAYQNTPSPPALDHRFLWEDSAAGIAPLLTLADIAGERAPTLEAFMVAAESLLGRALSGGGRSRDALGLHATDMRGLHALLTDVEAFERWRAGMPAFAEA